MITPHNDDLAGRVAAEMAGACRQTTYRNLFFHTNLELNLSPDQVITRGLAWPVS